MPKIAVIDAEIIGKAKHRFPNLAIMKISSYHKSIGDSVDLKLDYDNLNEYDIVYVSKVFTDTVVPDAVLTLQNVVYGGTGFYYDKAKPLPQEIEHSKPDYDLYLAWVNDKLLSGEKRKDFAYYLDYSIGFTTRGCIRGCSFCVNKNYKQSLKHSPVSEFMDESRPKICLLDDNVLASSSWKTIFEELIHTGKKFQYKQGMDERLLTKEKCEYIFEKSNWDGDYIFAFDNFNERDIIIDKLDLIRSLYNPKGQTVKFYVFTGYNHLNPGEYNEEFYKNDIVQLMERIFILGKYNCLPYTMRYADYENFPFPYNKMYVNIACWTNQPNFLKKMTLEQFSMARGMSRDLYKKYLPEPRKYVEDGHKMGSSWKALEEFKKMHPSIYASYFTKKVFD